MSNRLPAMDGLRYKERTMASMDSYLTTGLPGLDRLFRGLIPGDNVVWQVDSVDDYRAFVDPYCQAARRNGQKVIYIRFAEHEPLVDDQPGTQIHQLQPEAGFENFITRIHEIIEKNGRGGFYVFDCLSDLAVDWLSDQMLGNFFMLTCPYLFDIQAIAYFMLRRNYHSFHATGAISETTQILVDVYRHKGRLYAHPLKVQHRYSPTMHMLHVWQDEEFRPVSSSATIAEILTSTPWLQLQSGSYPQGIWARTFLEAEEVHKTVQAGEAEPAEARDYLRRLLRMAITRDERLLGLAERYISLGEVLTIGTRMIGSGLIGGKSVGMLLARAALRSSDGRWSELLEPHDSFFIGSDVFYTFLVRNGIWWVRQQQRDAARFLDGAVRARQRMITGEFPEHIMKQFESMLDYFGQSPFIVRSSSLLEDAFGNAFAGKYESVFCANQGPRHRRLDDFISAVRTIYASAMSEKALRYRAARGLLDKDEQMALLVQRVSGSMHGQLYYPHVAGVGFSFNPYVWSEYIKPEAGMVRLVFGLGTRAVDRSDDDYTRVVALDAPDRRPEANFDEVRQYAQRRVDYIDLEANHLTSGDFREVVQQSDDLPLDLFASRDQQQEHRAAETGRKAAFPYVLTFERLFRQTDFIPTMKSMLQTLQKAYDYPVDVEFTANFDDDRYKINLVQCRPLQVKGGGTISDPPAWLRDEHTVLEARGAVIGQSRQLPVHRVIYVRPRAYGQLPIADRYAVARLVGRLTHAPLPPEAGSILLMGPGRWGTTTPSLGVPVSYGDISPVSVLCEIVAMRDDLIPDVSLGTHFLNELVELDTLYMALFPHKEGNRLNDGYFDQAPSRLLELAPDAERWKDVVRVIDAADRPIVIHANTLKQRVVGYVPPDGQA